MLLITQKGTIVRQRVAAISQQGRAATGVRLQNLDADDHVASVAIVPADLDDGEDEGECEGADGAAADAVGGDDA